jgi:hypothetical protein
MTATLSLVTALMTAIASVARCSRVSGSVPNSDLPCPRVEIAKNNAFYIFHIL